MLFSKVKQIIVGKPKNLKDRSLFHKLSLIPLLAWIGIGADGLSSSSYGPEETFKALGDHKYLAIIVALFIIITIVILCTTYSKIMEKFPNGGGGYIVASKLLGSNFGLVSGCALLVDYV